MGSRSDLHLNLSSLLCYRPTHLTGCWVRSYPRRSMESSVRCYTSAGSLWSGKSGKARWRRNVLPSSGYYLLGHAFTHFSDHAPLRWHHCMKDNNLWIMRWYLTPQPFSFQLVHRPGMQMVVADSLSCLTEQGGVGWLVSPVWSTGETKGGGADPELSHGYWHCGRDFATGSIKQVGSSMTLMLNVGRVNRLNCDI